MVPFGFRRSWAATWAFLINLAPSWRDVTWSNRLNPVVVADGSPQCATIRGRPCPFSPVCSGRKLGKVRGTIGKGGEVSKSETKLCRPARLHSRVSAPSTEDDCFLRGGVEQRAARRERKRIEIAGMIYFRADCVALIESRLFPRCPPLPSYYGFPDQASNLLRAVCLA